jgi:hypothetical protein
MGEASRAPLGAGGGEGVKCRPTNHAAGRTAGMSPAERLDPGLQLLSAQPSPAKQAVGDFSSE